MNNKLPDIHKAAMTYKNRYRLKHDGGRAWIKDSQLHAALRAPNTYMVTRKDGQDTEAVVPYGTEELPESEA